MGYYLNTAGTECLDVDECTLETDNCYTSLNDSLNDEYCNNIAGSFQCSCPLGLELDVDNATCVDINECNRGSNFEHSKVYNAFLSTTPVSGYRGMWVNNGDDYCSQICTNTDEDFFCSCAEGYTLQNDEINYTCGFDTCTNDVKDFTCLNIDECATGDNNCETATCNDLDGTYECVCNTPDLLLSDEVNCDVNECLTDNGGCNVGGFTSAHAECVNEVTAEDDDFHCVCGADYHLRADGLTCEINECITLNNGGCSDTCTKIDGGYVCTCRTGYRETNDDGLCEEIDECLENHPCEQECYNTAGSYECGCDRGYELDSDNTSCQDIDECATDNGGCEDVCANNAGGFVCRCSNVGDVLSADGFSCNTDFGDAGNVTPLPWLTGLLGVLFSIVLQLLN